MGNASRHRARTRLRLETLLVVSPGRVLQGLALLRLQRRAISTWLDSLASTVRALSHSTAASRLPRQRHLPIFLPGGLTLTRDSRQVRRHHFLTLRSPGSRSSSSVLPESSPVARWVSIWTPTCKTCSTLRSVAPQKTTTSRGQGGTPVLCRLVPLVDHVKRFKKVWPSVTC